MAAFEHCDQCGKAAPLPEGIHGWLQLSTLMSKATPKQIESMRAGGMSEQEVKQAFAANGVLVTEQDLKPLGGKFCRPLCVIDFLSAHHEFGETNE